MNDLEQNLRRHLKSEADDILFGNLHFDTRMREQVLARIAAEERGRFIFRKWFRRARASWAFGGSAAVAALLILLLVFSLNLRDGRSDFVETPAPLSVTGGTHEAAGTRTWTVQTTEEAGAAFGSGLRIPSYSPDDTPLSGIQLTGDGEGKAVKVVFHYMYGDISYMVIADKGLPDMRFEGFEKVGVGGSEGYLKSGAPDTELHWSVDGVHYTVIGIIKGEEALKIARSMK